MKIAIIGSGIAGICLARALADLAQNNFSSQMSTNQKNNFQSIENITIFEKASSLDQALLFSPSGNPVGILHPLISKHQFSREWTDQGISTTIRWIKELNVSSEFYNFCGVLHLPRDKKQSLDWLQWENYQNSKSDFITQDNLIKKYRYLKSDTNAVWSSHCGWIDPKEFIKAALKETKLNLGEKLKMIFNSKIQLEQLETPQSYHPKHPLQSFDSIVIATGFGSPDLIKQTALKKKKFDRLTQNFSCNKPLLELVNGQLTGISFVDQKWNKNFKLKSIFCKSGYVTPIIKGFIYSGASYETVKAPHDIPTKNNRIANIKRLTNLISLRNLPSNFGNQKIFDRVSTRCVSKDKLPVIGLIDDKNPKIYALTALGSRGLSWGPLAAEYLAKEILFKNNLMKENIIDKHILPCRFRTNS